MGTGTSCRKDRRMQIQELRKAQRADLFRPFKVHLADGRESGVEHPEFIWVSRNERIAVIDDVDGSIEIIDPMLITSLSIPSRQQEVGDR